MKKQTADDQFYTIDLGSENALLGLLDVFGWVSRNDRPNDPESPDPQIIRELTDYVNDLYSSGDFVLRVDFGQLEQIRKAFDVFMGYANQFEDGEEFEAANSDVKVDDILEAEEVLDGATAATMDPSSNNGLEDIPTMDREPDGSKVNPIPGTEQFIDPLGPSTPAAKALALGNCPKCGFMTTPDELNPGQLKCSQCGWEGDKLPSLGESAKNLRRMILVQDLEAAFEAPSTEHPLGPHTGAETTDEEESAEEGSDREFYTSGRFINIQKGWSAPPTWAVVINPAAGQREPEPGDWAEIAQKTKNYAQPIPVTLVEGVNVGTWIFKNGHHPTI